MLPWGRLHLAIFSARKGIVAIRGPTVPVGRLLVTTVASASQDFMDQDWLMIVYVSSLRKITVLLYMKLT